MSSAESVIHQDVVEAWALESFAFLDVEPGIRHHAVGVVLAYVLPELIVEVELDYRDADAFVRVDRPGDPPLRGGYRLRRARQHLTDVLRDTEQAESLRAAARLPRGQQAMLDQLTAAAAALRSALPELPRLLRPA
jgi:hypothetical protein